MEIIFGNDKTFQFENDCKYCMLNPPQRGDENVFSRCYYSQMDKQNSKKCFQLFIQHLNIKLALDMLLGLILITLSCKYICKHFLHSTLMLFVLSV